MLNGRLADAVTAIAVCGKPSPASQLARAASSLASGEDVRVGVGARLSIYFGHDVRRFGLAVGSVREASEVLYSRGMLPDGFHDPGSSRRRWPCPSCCHPPSGCSLGPTSLPCGLCGEGEGRTPLVGHPSMFAELLAFCSLGPSSLVAEGLADEVAAGCSTVWRVLRHGSIERHLRDHQLFDETGLGHRPGGEYAAAFAVAWRDGTWPADSPFTRCPWGASGAVTRAWAAMRELASAGVFLLEVVPPAVGRPPLVHLAVEWPFP